MAKSNDPSYPIGYKKPPRDTQFQPGQSGNPNGRPKKISTIEDSLRKELPVLVTAIDQNGNRRKISKQVAMVRKQVDKAALGDLQSAKWVHQLAQQFKSNEGSRLEELIRTMREGHTRLEEADRNRRRGNKSRAKQVTRTSGSSTPEADPQ